MVRPRLVVTTFSAALLIQACADSAPVMGPAEVNTPNFVPAEHTPRNPGPIVDRNNTAAILLAPDPATSLGLIAGADVSPEEICEGADFTVEGPNQAVLTPPGGENFIFAGEVTAQVFRITGDPQDLCEFVSEELVAVGPVTMQAHLTIRAQGGFVLHVKLEGVVELTSGGQALLQATGQTVFRPFDTDLAHLDRTRITLTPL